MLSYRRRRAMAERLARFEAPTVNSGRIAKNTLVLYLRMFAAMLVGFATARYTLQALGVDDYGLCTVGASVVGMFTFLNGSLATASSRFLTVEMGKGTPGSIKRVFSTVLIVHIILACIFVVLLETVGLMVLETKLNIAPNRIFAVKCTYQCSIVSMFLGVTQVPYGAAVVAHERMSAFAWMAIYDVVVKLLITIALCFYPGDRLILSGVLWTLSGITTRMIYRIYCRRNFSEARLRWVFDRRMLKSIFSFTGWQIAAQTSIMLMSHGVVMLNQRYFGPALIAALSLAYTVNGQVMSFISSFTSAANPQTIKLFAAGKFQESKNLLIETIVFAVYLFLIIGVPIWFHSNDILSIWLGPTMPALSPAFVKIVMAGTLFAMFDTSFYTILYASGRIRENAFCNIALCLMFFMFTWAMIYFFRSVYSSCVSMLLMHAVVGMVVKPMLLHHIAGYGLHDFRRIFVPAFAALAVCASLAYAVGLVMPKGRWYAIPSCAITVGLEVIFLYLFVCSERLQGQLARALQRIPGVGDSSIRVLVRLSARVYPLRRRLGIVE